MAYAKEGAIAARSSAHCQFLNHFSETRRSPERAARLRGEGSNYDAMFRWYESEAMKDGGGMADFKRQTREAIREGLDMGRRELEEEICGLPQEEQTDALMAKVKHEYQAMLPASEPDSKIQGAMARFFGAKQNGRG